MSLSLKYLNKMNVLFLANTTTHCTCNRSCGMEMCVPKSAWSYTDNNAHSNLFPDSHTRPQCPNAWTSECFFSRETLPFKNKSSVPMTIQHFAIAEKTHLLHTTWQGLALGIRAKNKCGEFLKQDRCRQLKPSPCRSPCPCQSRL